MGDEKSSAEIAEDVERLVKKPVSDTPEKVEVQKPKYDEKPIIPYPQRLRKNKFDKQFGRFMDISIHCLMGYVSDQDHHSTPYGVYYGLP